MANTVAINTLSGPHTIAHGTDQLYHKVEVSAGFTHSDPQLIYSLTLITGTTLLHTEKRTVFEIQVCICNTAIWD